MRYHADHQIAALGLLGAHHPARQAHFHRLGLADRLGQALRSTHTRSNAQIDFGLAELGVFARDDEIGHHGELASAAQGEAVDRRDPGLAGLLHDLAGPGSEEILEIEVGRFLLAHFLDVRARREGLFARSGQDGAKLRLVGLIGGEGLDQIFENLRVKRIQRLGAVQRDEGDAALALRIGFGGDGFVIGHFSASRHFRAGGDLG